MKILSLFFTTAFLLISLSAIKGGNAISVNPQATTSPTPIPTYDPLAEPFLPENPSELELGRYWYWHNCMTCHGDVGQGLTDEFRAIWPEDHRNCWAHGCHGGNRDDGGFPIPTYVPPLVSNAKLAQFTSQQGFYAFLKSTHPPQNPGILEDAEYLAIVRYVFTMNDRPLGEDTQVPTITPTVTLSSISDEVPAVNTPLPATMIYLGFVIVLLIVVIWRLQLDRPKE
jgi:hypothetical protein